MKIKIDKTLCTGHAMCNAQGGGDLFPLDALGYNALEGTVDVPAGQEDTARRGAAACPERAISVIE